MFIIRMPLLKSPRKRNKKNHKKSARMKKKTTDYQYTSNVMCLYESNFRELLCEIVNPKIQIMHNFLNKSISMKESKKELKRKWLANIYFAQDKS